MIALEIPFPQKKHGARWTQEQLEALRSVYPTAGLKRTAEIFGVPTGTIRGKVSKLGIRIDHTSEHAQEWQRRAAESKIGKKRPGHGQFMRDFRATHVHPMATPEARKRASESQRARIAERGHPRGALGMKHTDAAKAIISTKSKATWAAMTEQQRIEKSEKMLRTMRMNGTEPKNREGASWKAGWREVGGRKIYFRSRWEANYGRYLEWLRINGQIKCWDHEPVTFWFEKIKRGSRSYLPDFQVEECGGAIVYHEVKGWMDARSKTKIKRMRIYFPEVRLIVIDSKGYKALCKTAAALVPEWES